MSNFPCGHCPALVLKYSVLTGLCAVFNIIIDFVLSLFPWLVTWKLRIERYEKVGLCVAMSLGTL